MTEEIKKTAPRKKKMTLKEIKKNYNVSSPMELLGKISDLSEAELKISAQWLSKELEFYGFDEDEADNEFNVTWDEFYTSELPENGQKIDNDVFEGGPYVGDHRLDNTMGRLATMEFLIDRASDVDWDSRPSMGNIFAYIERQTEISSLQDKYRRASVVDILPFYEDDISLVDLTRRGITRDVVDGEFTRDSYEDDDATEEDFYDLIYIIGLLDLKQVNPKVKRKLMAARRAEEKKEDLKAQERVKAWSMRALGNRW